MAIASAIVVEVGIFVRLMILLNRAMERGLSILVLLRYNITLCVLAQGYSSKIALVL